jgi:hypothetical protein
MRAPPRRYRVRDAGRLPDGQVVAGIADVVEATLGVLASQGFRLVPSSEIAGPVARQDPVEEGSVGRDGAGDPLVAGGRQIDGAPAAPLLLQERDQLFTIRQRGRIEGHPLGDPALERGTPPDQPQRRAGHVPRPLPE